MSNRRQIILAEDAQRFIVGGKATFTAVSKSTGNRFTFKASVSDNPALLFVSVLTGSDNESSYTYLGTLRAEYAPGTSYVWKHGVKSKISPDAPSAKAFAWVWANLKQGRIPDSLEVWHEGKCCRCNRKLTVPASIESGIGPECARREVPAVAAMRRTFRADVVGAS